MATCMSSARRRAVSSRFSIGTKRGLVLNDAELFNGFWYASSYFTASYAGGADPDENKWIRFKTLEDFVSGNWEDLSSLVPGGLTPIT